jgi:hypothetical protein
MLLRNCDYWGTDMATLKDMKEMLAVLMESPIYLTMPPYKRLALVKQNEPGLSRNLRSSILGWVKTGIFNYPPYQGRF